VSRGAIESSIFWNQKNADSLHPKIRVLGAVEHEEYSNHCSWKSGKEKTSAPYSPAPYCSLEQRHGSPSTVVKGVKLQGLPPTPYLLQTSLLLYLKANHLSDPKQLLDSHLSLEMITHLCDEKHACMILCLRYDAESLLSVGAVLRLQGAL
jgi:hypothetical protein